MSIYATDGSDAIDMGLTIDEIIAELVTLGFHHFDFSNAGGLYGATPAWRAQAISEHVRSPIAKGEGATAVEAWRDCHASAMSLGGAA